MTKALRIVVAGMVFLMIGLGGAARRSPAQDTREQQWIKSGDPCWGQEQLKAQIKSMYGVNPDYLKCKPVRINMDWDIDEVFHHHSGLGEDRFKAKIRVSFRGFIDLNYDQQKRSQLHDYLISGPAPCCPGKSQIDTSMLQAAVLGWKPKGFSSQEFKMFDVGGDEILTNTDKPGHFGLKWRRDGLDRKTEAGGPMVGIAKGTIPKPYSFGGPVWIMDHHNYHPNKPAEPPSWDELKPFYDKQDVWRGKYELADRVDFPGAGALSEFWALRGSLQVEVDFGEEEEEEWLMSVDGQETDTNPEAIGSTIAPASLQLPTVTFNWNLGAKIRVRKRKGVRTLEDTMVTRFDLAPKLIFDPNLPYRCDFTPCQGGNSYDQAPKYVGLLITGRLQGDSVGVTWPGLASQACVQLIKKGGSGANLPLRFSYGSKDFTEKVSHELLPLKDGASKTGNMGKALTYKVTLKKLS